MRMLFSRLSMIPHLFGKGVVVWCVAMGTICSLWSIRVLSRTGQDPSSLLAVILAFLGGELALMFGRHALKGKEQAGQPGGKEN
ncbi:MAG: hypothetical protein E7440_03950 [Ruminococcaceae bacterium]|nr:hypothetical protein [Oscillospiraceae bacterium]